MEPSDVRADRRALVVCDDTTQLSVVREYLMRAQFSVQSATDLRSAHHQLEQGGRVDLVVISHAPTSREAHRFRERCVAQPETRDLPFLFVIPESDIEGQVGALRACVDDLITAPFDPVVLVARAEAILARRQAYEELVRVDPLTRLLNRRTFTHELDTEIARLKRYERTAGVLVLDVDGLADLNRDQGVATGDLLLTCLSGVVLSSIRNVDLAGRVDGDKIVVFLPETPPEGAELLATRIQDRLQRLAEELKGEGMSVLCGVLEAPRHGDTVDTLVQHGREAIQKLASANGKRVAHYEPSAAPA